MCLYTLRLYSNAPSRSFSLPPHYTYPIYQLQSEGVNNYNSVMKHPAGNPLAVE
ncbi:hypothetical protein AG1IA_03185 [Rhizoctonia solani AG-1 IA]|uniref:Uncharacterized protein n=1 Tax=Thanatephorus cucumeris (strain AG1-IA) TaxID=983506 RepID=L8X1A3_THACA|nr:hypothetical protein AG1IA_03185 [Rhizoctonia solani AG-1 IA]